MKQYVDAPEALLRKINELRKRLDVRFACVSSPKPRANGKEGGKAVNVGSRAAHGL